MGSRQGLGEKDIDRQRLGKGGHDILTGLRDGVDLVFREVKSEKESNPRQVDEDDGDKIYGELDVIPRSVLQTHLSSP
jgi:hypothetical protein